MKMAAAKACIAERPLSRVALKRVAVCVIIYMKLG
jgi:hypothetical protein